MAAEHAVHVRLGSAEEVRPLRMRVLRAGRPVSESAYAYDDLAETVHVVAVGGGEVVGVATVFPEPYDDQPGAWRLRGMAVAPPYQGKGVGSAVLVRVVDELLARSVPLLWCNARTTALPFYRRHGFTTVGEEFLAAPDIPHCVAVLALSR